MGCAVQTRGFPKRRAAVRLTILLLAALQHDVRRKRDVAFVNAVLVVVAQHSGATAATASGIVQQALCWRVFLQCVWLAGLRLSVRMVVYTAIAPISGRAVPPMSMGTFGYRQHRD